MNFQRFQTVTLQIYLSFSILLSSSCWQRDFYYLFIYLSLYFSIKDGSWSPTCCSVMTKRGGMRQCEEGSRGRRYTHTYGWLAGFTAEINIVKQLIIMHFFQKQKTWNKKRKSREKKVLDSWHLPLTRATVAQTVKALAKREAWVQSLGREDSLEKEMATHSSTLAWKIPWMEETRRLESMGLQRIQHDWLHFHFLSLSQ